jgi:hypothetical protein
VHFFLQQAYQQHRPVPDGGIFLWGMMPQLGWHWLLVPVIRIIFFHLCS